MTLESDRRWLCRERLPDAALFLAGFLSVAPQIYNARFSEGFETFAVASNLAAFGQYANPFAFPTGPTAMLPPVYPFFVALLLKICGAAGAFAAALTLCHMLAHALHAALLPRLSDLLFRDRLPGILAAFLFVVLPLVYFSPHSEAIFCPVGLMLFCLASDRRLPRGGVGGALFTGVFAGILVLLNPTCIVLCCLWLAYLAWRGRMAFAQRSAMLITLAFLVTLAPWTIRNFREFHSLYFVRDNLGLELYVSNNDAAQADSVGNLVTGVRLYHPGSSVTEGVALRDLGEAAYMRARLSTAFDWMLHHPRRFLVLTAEHILLFWFPDAEGFTAAHGYAVACLDITGLAGLVLMIRRRIPAAAFLASGLVLYPPLYSFVQMDGRYRAPALWFSLLSAGYVLAILVEVLFPKPVAPLETNIPQLHLLD